MTKTAANGVLLKDSVNPVFLNYPFGCRCLTLDLTTYSTATRVTPESLEGLSTAERVLRYQRCDTLRNAQITLFAPFLFPAPARSNYILFLQESSTPAIIGNTLPNHGIAPTLLYTNRELTYTLCLAYSAATTLRAGGGTRNVLLQRRFRSAISRSSFRVGPDVAPGIKCKYNCARISRLYLASDLRTIPPPPNRDHCDPQRLRIFPPRRLRSV